jgi:hypothetical protein
MFLNGWAGYFRYGNSARVLGQVGNYALRRLGLWLSKKGNRRHGWRWGIIRAGTGNGPSLRNRASPRAPIYGLNWRNVMRVCSHSPGGMVRSRRIPGGAGRGGRGLLPGWFTRLWRLRGR